MRRYTASCLGLGFALAAAPAWSDDRDESLPAPQVVAAIQAAVAAQPGSVREVEVKREKQRALVEVEIVAADGRKHEVKVDAGTNQVVR